MAFQKATKVDRRDIQQVLGRLSDEIALIQLKNKEPFTKVAVYLGKEKFTDKIKESTKCRGFLLVEATAAAKKVAREHM